MHKALSAEKYATTFAKSCKCSGALNETNETNWYANVRAASAAQKEIVIIKYTTRQPRQQRAERGRCKGREWDDRESCLDKRLPLPLAIVCVCPSLHPTSPLFLSHPLADWQLQLAGSWQNIRLQIRFIMFPEQLLQKILRIRLRRAINNFTAVYGYPQ